MGRKMPPPRPILLPASARNDILAALAVAAVALVASHTWA